jgi:hypothetical protein
MPIPQALVTRYFQLIVNRQFTEAERELERLKQKMQKTEYNRGYFRALYGMLLSRRSSNDNYALLSKLDLTDKASLHMYRREFLEHTRNGLHGDFDRGYFSAWSDCMRILARLNVRMRRFDRIPTKNKPLMRLLGSDKESSTWRISSKAKLRL